MREDKRRPARRNLHSLLAERIMAQVFNQRSSTCHHRISPI